MEIVSRDQLEASLADLCTHVRDPRAGILGPSSIAWQLGTDLGVFLGGGRAALLQLAHPMVAHAIDQHSRTRSDVIGRFQRTFHHVFAMLFGSLDEAFTAARRVHTIHTHIHGTIPDAIGAYPAGTPYHANDAESLRWVHTTLVDTTIQVRELLDGPLAISVKDAYVTELHRFAQLFGIPRRLLPASWAEHAAYVAQMLASDRLAVAPCAREMARFLVGRGGSAQPPLGRISELVTHALLPPHLADQFALRGAPRRTQLGLAAFAACYRCVPRRALTVPALTEARRRLAGRSPSRFAAWTERQLIGLAQRATGS
ncbi:MAG: oxygenase MpaB family protein [Kofleriaceae bacterium]